MKKYYRLVLTLFIVLIVCLPLVTKADMPHLSNPLGSTDISVLSGKLINKVLGIVGVIALVMFIYGGILWMTSAGNEEQIKKGRDTLAWATIGIAFIFFAYTLVHYVLNVLIETS